MDRTTEIGPTDAEPTDYKAAIIECIEEIDLVRKAMEADQEEIDQLKAETREMLARLRAA